jgi:hypothetical protein
MHRITLIVLGVLALMVTGHALAAARTFACQNWLERDWPRTLLHYELTAQPGELVPGKVELIDGQGAPVACQLVVIDAHRDGSLQRGRVSFYAELKKGAAWRYTLQAAVKPTVAPARVTATRKGAVLEVTSSGAGVRVPAVGSHTFKRPVAPRKVPAPLLGWRLVNGHWAGHGWLESDRLVTGWSQRVVADGPLYKEYAYEVRFAPGAAPRNQPGYYRMRVRVEAEDPLVYVAEEYDFGSITAGKDLCVLALNRGLPADTALWSAYTRAPSKPELARASRQENDTNIWRAPLAFDAEREHARLFPHNDFGTHTQWYGLFAAGEADTPAPSPYLGVMTAHTGAWRLPSQSASSIYWTTDGQVQLRLRISCNLSGMPSNPFNTAEIDPALPQTLGRRMWALVLGPRPGLHTDGKTLDVARFDGYRAYQGFITLDDYKDWILAWTPGTEIVRPRVFTTPEQVARLKANLDRCPGQEALKEFSLLTGDPRTAKQEALRALQGLSARQNLLDWYMTHYRVTQNFYEPAFLADSALASPAVPDEVRQKLLANVAFFCYLWSCADFTPRGAALHMGNPNMPINRFMALPLFAALIPDHPQAKAWLDESYAYLKWKVSSNIASGGGMFRETLPYATYGPSIFFTTASIALRNAGYDIDRFEPLKEFGRYLNAVDTPATTVRGRPHDRLVGLNGRQVRVLPGLMRGSDVAGGQSRMMFASLTAKSDPAYAAEMMGAFYEAGGFLGTEMTGPYMWIYWDPDIPARSVPRRESVIAGLGGILRAHVGTPDEAYVALRMGYSQQRGTDQGSLAFYAHGVNLVPPSGLSAGHAQAGIWPHSVVAYGDPPADHEHGRVDTNIEDYGFLPSMGYLLGRQTFKGRGRQLAKLAQEVQGMPDAFDIFWSKQFQELPRDFIRSRQTLLLRAATPAGPTYVVLRDSTQGDCPLPSHWYLWLTAPAEKVQRVPGGVRVSAPDDVILDVQVLEPGNAEVAVTAVTPIRGYAEAYSQLRVAQGHGRGYLTVLFPYRAGQAPPRRIERLGEGIIRVVTAESTDYVFCAVDQPVVFTDALVTINAYAGAVRIYPDKVLLVNASGRHGAVGYKGVVCESDGPAEWQTAVNPAKAETVHAGVAWPPVPSPASGGTLFTVDGSGKHPAAEVTGAGLTGWIQVHGSTVTYAMAAGAGQVGYKDFYVKGEAPFTVVHEPGKITLTAEGRRRIFQLPIPANLVPPQLLPPEETLPLEYRHRRDIGGFTNWPWSVDVSIDSVSMMNGWYDGVMAIGLDSGRHTAVITRYTNPPVWRENAYTRLLP